MRKRGEHGVLLLAVSFMLMFTLIAVNYYSIADVQEYVSAAEQRSLLKVIAGESQGTIYDRNMKPLCNTVVRYQAVAVPRALDREKTAVYAVNAEKFYEEYDKGRK